MQQASRRKTAFGASAGGPAEDLTQNVPLSRVVSQKMNFWGHGNKGGLYFVCRLGKNGRKSSCSPAARRRTMDCSGKPPRLSSPQPAGRRKNMNRDNDMKHLKSATTLAQELA